MHQFRAAIELIGTNPFVFVPDDILREIFSKAGKDKGPIPVSGAINDKPYRQTLVKYSGAWRLYINTTMLKDSPKRTGEMIAVTIAYDPASRAIEPPLLFIAALAANKVAQAALEGLPASRQLEIVRYLARLKTEEALQKNIARAINFLLGKERFVGRDKP